MNLKNARIEVFSSTTDPARAREIYGEVLGLEHVYETPSAMVFDAGDVHLRVQFVDQVLAPSYTVLGWTVDDLQATLSGLVTKGVKIERYPGLELDESGIWDVPDGNTISLAELA